MRHATRRFVKMCSEHFELPDPIYEFGALQVSGHESEDLRTVFPDRTFIGADMRDGPGVDVTLNLHDIELADESVGCVISLDTLEHVEHPRRAVSEIHRILKDGGIAIISSVFEFPIHGYPNDYWRFTPEGFRSLLKVFPHSFVGSYGLSEDVPRTVVGIGFKGPLPEMAGFEKDYANWRSWYTSLMKNVESPGRTD